MKTTFYSNGKLLITGEYLVLNGAKALALPTIFGQNLIVEESESDSITWKSFDANGSVWIDVQISFEQIRNNSFSSENSIEVRLVNILFEASKLQPDFLENKKGFKVQTNLSFPREWGLGTSSTLINNIANWLNINPYKLLENTFTGSGYDIACAQSNNPILYQLEDGQPKFHNIDFHPSFAPHLFFVYLNQKQNSKAAIANYYSRQQELTDTIEMINEITTQVVEAKELSTFAYLLDRHEAIISNLLEIPTVKESLFSDFTGSVKSLGAWGGDFVLVVAKDDPTEYFKQKGFHIVIPYEEMILNNI